MSKRLTILTCPDRKQYLENTIESLKKAGLDNFQGEKIIYVDGYRDTFYRKFTKEFEVIQLELYGFSLEDKKAQTKKSLLHIMRAAARDSIDYLYYFEDDIALSKNTLSVMETVGVPNHLAFVSYCDLKDIGFKYGIAEAPGYDFEAPEFEGGHWGNQALVIPLHSLEMLTKHSIPEWVIHKGEHNFASDILISIMMATGGAEKRLYGVFYPSLVQHTGDISLVNPAATTVGWGRSTLSFKGEEFDASTLDLSKLEFYQGHVYSNMTRQQRLELRFREIRGKRNMD
jgi:hypothetical protein